jgi:hypothetical protein
MTLEDQRKACSVAIARAFIGEGPWNDPHTTEERRQAWISDGEDALDALDGLVWVIPLGATIGARPLRYGNVENNDLTKPPKVKP